MTIHESVIGDGVVRWTIDNPPRRNAVGPDDLDFIARRCATLAGEVVLVTGAGAEVFCSGFDLTALGLGIEELPDAPLVRATTAMSTADATFVAVIQGHVIGAGVELACTCDVRIARRGTYFAVPVARVGVVYHARGLAQMHGVLGDAVAKRLMLLGQRVDTTELVSAGALVGVVESSELDGRVDEIVRALHAGAPASQRAHRDFMRHLSRTGLGPEVLVSHDLARRQAYASADHDEGRKALLEGRTPHFRGP